MESRISWQFDKQSCSFSRYYTDTDICLDKYGIPCTLFRLSVGDPAGAVREIGPEFLLLASLSRLEKMHELLRAAMLRLGKVIVGQIQIIDVGDYGLVPNWRSRMYSAFSLGPDLWKVFDANYPETVRKVFIVRTGAISRMIWDWVSPLASKRTRQKIRLFGSCAGAWRDELRSEFAPQQTLPEFLLCDDKKVCMLATPRGGIIPEGAARGVTSQKAQQVTVTVASTKNASQSARSTLFVFIVAMFFILRLISPQILACTWISEAFQRLNTGTQRLNGMTSNP